MARITPIPDPARPEDHGGARTAAIDTIVLHTTEGNSAAGAARWWDRPDVTASAHYILDGARGEVVQRVDEELVAWHCANAAVHQRSIGIEIVGFSGHPETYSLATMKLLVALCADICDRHPVQLVHALPGIIGHADVPDPKHPGQLGGVSHHTDPAGFPWSAFLAALAEELAAEPHELRYPPAPPAGPGGAT